MFDKMKSAITATAATITVLATTIGLTASGGVISVESGDIANVNTAGGNFLTSSFEITNFLGTIAMVGGGFFVLNKLMSIIPKGGSAK